METKYLWDRVDALRDALKDIKEENDDLIAENKHLKLRVEELDGFSDDVDVERSRAEVENYKLKARIVDLKDKVKSKMRIGDAFHRDLIVSNDINKELRRHVKTLKAELNDFKSNYVWSDEVDKLKAENDELNAELVNTYDKNEDLRIDLKQAIKLRDKFGQERDDNKKNVDILKSELRTQKKGHLKSVQGRIDVIKELQVENDDLKAENCGLINESKWDKNKLIKELQAENDSLKDEAVKWNRKYNKLNDDYNNDHKVHNDYEDGLLKEIKELKMEIKGLNGDVIILDDKNKMKADKIQRLIKKNNDLITHKDRIPKDYKKEAEEFFEHNPNQSKVWFYMLNEDDMENIDNLHCLGEDDAICTISND